MEEQSSGSSEERVKELTDQGTQCLQSGQPQEALIHFQAALSLTEGLADKPKLKLSCLFNTGAALVTSGQHQRGISLLQSALSLLDSIPNHENRTEDDNNEQQQRTHNTLQQSPDHIRGDIYYNLGLANEGMGEWSLAVTQLKQSIDYYLKANQPSTAGDVFFALASSYRDQRDIKQQITALVSAQKLYHDSSDPAKEITCYTELAIAYQLLGKKEECVQMLTTAKIMGLRLDDVETQAQLYSQLGLVYSSLKMFPDAIQSFERSLPLLRLTKGGPTQVQQEASLLQNIGAVYNEMGQFIEAMMYHKTAASLYNQTGQSLNEAKCLCNLALCQSHLKEYNTASQSFTTALTLAQESQDHPLQFQALEGLGSIAYHTKDYPTANTYFNQALSQLNCIRDDNTGVARERVMEKLSCVTELLQKGTNGRRGSLVEECDTPSRKNSRIKLVSSSHSNRSRRGSLTQVMPIPPTPRNTVKFSEMSFSQSRPPVSGGGTPIRRHGNRQREPDPSATLDDNNLHSSTFTSLTATSDSSLMTSVFNDEITDHTHQGGLPTSPIIQQGSLALGPNAKVFYKVEKQEIETTKRGRLKSQQVTRIVPVNADNHTPLETAPTPRSTRSSVCILL